MHLGSLEETNLGRALGNGHDLISPFLSPVSLILRLLPVYIICI